MLIFSRKETEQICLGDDIVLTVVKLSGDKVRIGIKAPKQVAILRNELELSTSRAAPTLVREQTSTTAASTEAIAQDEPAPKIIAIEAAKSSNSKSVSSQSSRGPLAGFRRAA